MTRSRDKLQEARYFLQRMEEIQKLFGRADGPSYEEQRDHFRYHANAFLCAFRGVTERVLPEEYKNATDSGGVRFTQWFHPIEQTLRQNNDFDFLVEARNATVHEEPVRPRAHFHVRIVTSEVMVIRNPIITHADGTRIHADGTPVTDEEATIRTSDQESVRPAPLDAPATAPNQAPTVLYFFKELPPNPWRKGKPMPTVPVDDVLTVCTAELDRLDAIVTQCEARFPL